MKLLLIASILLTSTYASVWPYHGGIEHPGTDVLVAPAYAVAPAISLLHAPTDKQISSVAEASAIVKDGSVLSTAIVSSGKATEDILSSNEQSKIVANSEVLSIRESLTNAETLVVPVETVSAVPSSNQQWIQGENNETTASSGRPVSTDVATVRTETETGVEITIDATTIETTAEVASTTAASIATNPATIDSIAVSSVALATDATAFSSASINVTSQSRLIQGEIATTNTIESSANSAAAVSENSGDSVVSLGKINLITPGRTVAIAKTPLSNIVASAQTVPTTSISGPTGSISAIGLPVFLLKKQFE